MKTARLAVLAAAALGAAPAHAADFTLSLFGVYAPSSVDYSETRTFQAFAEQGSNASAFSAGGGPGFEAGLTWFIKPRFGVGVAGGIVSRDSDAAYDARVPHPLFFAHDRTADGTVASLNYKEQQAHLDLVYRAGSGAFDFSVFAGPSYFNVSADLLGQPDYTQTYPFDTLTVTTIPSQSYEDTGFGWNAGAGVGYKISNSIGFGVQGRFSRATVELTPITGQAPVKIDAGGFQVAGGLRISF